MSAQRVEQLLEVAQRAAAMEAPHVLRDVHADVTAIGHNLSVLRLAIKGFVDEAQRRDTEPAVALTSFVDDLAAELDVVTVKLEQIVPASEGGRASGAR